MNWIRVTHRNPCPVCEKPDWCCIGEKFINCMRVFSEMPCDNGGYLHAIGDKKPKAKPDYVLPAAPSIDAPKLMRSWFSSTKTEDYERLADLLGVAFESLVALKCGWANEYKAWAFPMRNGAGVVVGIRLRAEDGKKWSVTGGREGIFVPSIQASPTALVVEGPTDTVAMLSIGRYAIGRPSCSGGIAALTATLPRLEIRRLVIIADNDPDKVRPDGGKFNPGMDGAERLANEIGVPCCLIVLPSKDAREFVSMGGTPALLDSLISEVIWHQPKQPSNKKTITHANP